MHNNKFSVKKTLKKLFTECKCYIADLNGSWLRKSVFISKCRYILLIVVLVVICLFLNSCDDTVLLGVSTGIAATFAVKIYECNRDMHLAFRRTRLIVENFIWNYENALSNGLNSSEIEHRLSNLYDDMILEASPLCYSQDYNQLSLGMSNVLKRLCKITLQGEDEERDKAFNTVKEKFKMLFKGR